MPPSPVRRTDRSRHVVPRLPSGHRSSLRADRTDGSRPHDRVPTVSRDRLEARHRSPGPAPDLQAVASTPAAGRVDRSRHVVPHHASGHRSSLRADRTDGSRPHDRVPTGSRDRLEARHRSRGPPPGLQAVASTPAAGRVDRSRHVVPHHASGRRSSLRADHTDGSRPHDRVATVSRDRLEARHRSRKPAPGLQAVASTPWVGHDTSSPARRAVTDRRSAPTAETVPSHTTASRRGVVTAWRPATGPRDPHRTSRRSRPPRRSVTTRRPAPRERSQIVAPRRPHRRFPTTPRRRDGES